MSLVSFVEIKQETISSMERAILQSLDLIDYSFRKEIKTVIIKPNMCYYWDYSTGATTDPRFVAALVNLLRKKIAQDIDISVVESDASAMKCQHVFKMLGYEELSKTYNIRLVNLSKDRSEIVEATAAGQRFRFMIPQIIQNADLKINISKIKYAMKKIELTCALKNVFGCNSFPKKYRYHPRLGEAIVAINKLIKFDLSIIDGNIVSGIQPRRLGLVMASRDPVAIDTAAAEIAGISLRKIKYIQLAQKEGLGKTSFVPRGLPIVYFRSAYPKKDIKKILMGRAYNLIVATRLGGRLGLG